MDARFTRVSGVCLDVNYTMRVTRTVAVNDMVHTYSDQGTIGEPVGCDRDASASSSDDLDGSADVS